MINIIKKIKTMSKEFIIFLPEIQTRLKLLMISNASSFDAGRLCSALRRLNTWLRNIMMERRLNAIMFYNIHKEKLEELIYMTYSSNL